MTVPVPAAVGLLVALVGTGCGTMQNLSPSGYSVGVSGGSEGTKTPTRVYGGVRGEWSELKAMRFDDVYCMNLIFLPLYLADLPLSAAADTLTLPYTIGVEVTRSINAYYFPPVVAKPDTVEE